MMSQSYQTERLVCLFLLGIVFFQYPILSIVNYVVRVMGIPLLFLYLFTTWAALIVVLMLIMESIEPEKQTSER